MSPAGSQHCHHHKSPDSISKHVGKCWPLSVHYIPCSSQAGEMAAPQPPAAGTITLTRAQCPTTTSGRISSQLQRQLPCSTAAQEETLWRQPIHHPGTAPSIFCFFQLLGLLKAPCASPEATRKTSPLQKPSSAKLILPSMQPELCTCVPLLLLQICVFPLNPTQKMLCSHHQGQLWPVGSAGLRAQGSGSAGRRQSGWHARG